MNASEATELLTFAAFYDGRTVAESSARAWAETLGDITLDEGRSAIVAHYRENTRWIMPANVRNRVTAARDDRAARGRIPAGRAAPPTGEYLRAKAALLRRTGRSAEAADAERQATEADDRPPGATIPTEAARAELDTAADALTSRQELPREPT